MSLWEKFGEDIFLAYASRRWACATICRLLSADKYVSEKHEALVVLARSQVEETPDLIIFATESFLAERDDQSLAHLLSDVRYEEYRRMKQANALGI